MIFSSLLAYNKGAELQIFMQRHFADALASGIEVGICNGRHDGQHMSAIFSAEL